MNVHRSHLVHKYVQKVYWNYSTMLTLYKEKLAPYDARRLSDTCTCIFNQTGHDTQQFDLLAGLMAEIR